MRPLRLVLDTNVLVSALLKPDGTQNQILMLAFDEPHTVYFTPDILIEYHEVLSRRKFGLDPRRVSHLILEFTEAGVMFSPMERVYASSDPDDNKFITCAAIIDADFLITGNIRDFPAQFGNTRIVNGRTFLDAIDGSP